MNVFTYTKWTIMSEPLMPCLDFRNSLYGFVRRCESLFFLHYWTLLYNGDQLLYRNSLQCFCEQPHRLWPFTSQPDVKNVFSFLPTAGLLFDDEQGPDMGSAAPGRVEKYRPPTVSGVTRGLSQGGNFSEGGPLAIVWACNN